MDKPTAEKLKNKIASPFDPSVKTASKRAAIISEAARAFNTNGARATTFADIAASLQLSKTSLYHYFSSKEELVFECYQTACQTLFALVGQAGQAENGRERLLTSIDLYIDYWRKAETGLEPHIANLTEIQSLSSDRRATVEQKYVEIVELFYRYIDEGVKDGSLAPMQRMPPALALFGLMQWMAALLPRLGPERADELKTRVRDVLSRGAAAGPPAANFALHPLYSANSFSPGFNKSAQAQNKVDAFLRVATRLFNTHGYKAVSLETIAQELGVTKGAFYYHIKNKDDLLNKCFEHSFRVIESAQRQAAANSNSGLNALRHALYNLFMFQNSPDGPLIRAGLIYALKPDKRSHYLSRLFKTSNAFAAMLQRGQEDGSVHKMDIALAQHLVLGAVYMSADYDQWRPLDSTEQAAHAFFHPLVFGLSPKARTETDAID